jgi:hypothetical protein
VREWHVQATLAMIWSKVAEVKSVHLEFVVPRMGNPLLKPWVYAVPELPPSIPDNKGTEIGRADLVVECTHGRTLLVKV